MPQNVSVALIVASGAALECRGSVSDALAQEVAHDALAQGAVRETAAVDVVEGSAPED